MITENLSTLIINKMSKAQYDRELAAGNIDENALYLIPDNGDDIDLSIYATKEELSGKSDSGHKHNISDVNELQTELDKKQKQVI